MCLVFSVFNYGYLTRDFAPVRTPPPLPVARGFFVGPVYVAKNKANSLLFQGDVSGKYWSFRRRGFEFSSQNDPNPTVRRYIADLKPKSRLTLPSGLRRQFQVDVSFFVFFLYVRRAPGFF